MSAVASYDLREPQTHFYPASGVLGFSLLPRLVPDPDVPCHFIADDDEAPFYPVYLSTPRIAAALIGECFAFEYYLAALDRSWLIGESHHDRIFGVGEAVFPLLDAYAKLAGNAIPSISLSLQRRRGFVNRSYTGLDLDLKERRFPSA